MIHINIANNVTATGCSIPVLAAAKKSLTLPNPSYHRLARKLGPYGVSRDFKYYKLNKTDPTAICFPRGFADRFIAYLVKNNIEHEVVKDFVTKRSKNAFKDWPEVQLRDYQVPIVEAILKADMGVVAASTGAGKTVITCALAKALGQSMTVLVPTTVIQEQFRLEFKKWFNYDVGIINGEEKTIKDVTVAMWQSLNSYPELVDKLSATTSTLVIDECHGAISKSRNKILQTFKPSRLYGLSGSPKRSKDDGRTQAIFFFLGPIIATYEATQITPTIDVVFTREVIPVDEFPVMEESVMNNDSRNRLIAGITMGEVGEGKQVLILLKRREHCQKIMELLPKSDMIWYADSDDPDRNDTLMMMRSGDREFSVIVGTVSLLATGTDIPSLNRLVLGASIKSEVLIQQGSGRILRLFEGKDGAKIYDLVDNLNHIYYNHWRERSKFYREKKWIITGLELFKER